MKWLMIIPAILLALLLLVFFTKIRVILQYGRHKGEDDHLKIQFRAWWGLLRYKIDVPMIKVPEESPVIIYTEEKGFGESNGGTEEKDVTATDLIHSFEDFQAIITHITGLHRIIRKFLKRVHVKRLDWKSEIGAGDAAHTGIIVGACWAIKGSIIGLLSMYLNVKVMPSYTIVSNFQKATASTSIYCIVEFRVGQAMLAGIKLFRFWKGGKVAFKSKSLANLTNDSN